MNRNKGFTLIELMVTLAVLAIIMGIAVPSFTSLIQNSRSTALANSVATALNHARSEAVKRNANVEFCSGDGSSCPGNWTAGWVVRLTDGTLLKTWDAPDAGVVITGGNQQITFRGTGQITGAAVNLTSRYTNCSGNQARNIRIATSGRISVRRTLCP